uniref:U3 small nucleolar RNA-associated protein 6 homolog C-terminal domain-containing protein n=1 Tax=Ciona savignyi TaxID=51511 RepID=H2ZPF7_CIOSA
MVAERFLKLAEHAHNGKHLNASRYVSWIDFLLQCGDAFRAFNVISDVCDSNNDPELWLKRLQIAHLVAVENDVDLELLFNKTLHFAKQMTRKQQCTFWSLWMHSCVAIDAESQAEDLITKKSVGCCSEALGILQHIYLSWVALKYDVNHAYQSFLRQVKPTRNPTAEQYKDVLKLLHSSPNIKQAVVEECYEFALQDHGSNNPDLWISYVQSLTEANKARKCGEIYWRAVKSLKPELTETFVAKYSLINCPIGS